MLTFVIRKYINNIKNRKNKFMYEILKNKIINGLLTCILKIHVNKTNI